MPAAKNQEALITLRPLYLARPNAAAFLSISETMLDQLVARGDAPKPRQLSAGRVAWLTEELEAWGKTRPTSELLPPAGSGYGRAGNPSNLKTQ